MNNNSEATSEQARLQALRDHLVMDTAPEPVFDEIVRGAAAACDMPIALLSFIDEYRQWFKARIGFELPELPRGIGFDAVALLQPGPLVVRDALEDPRFSCDPLVISEINIRSYVGVPIKTQEGYPIGVLSVMDYRERDLTPEQIQRLAELAQQVTLQLSLRRKRNTPAQTDREPGPLQIVPTKPRPDAAAREILPDVPMRFDRNFRYRYVSPFSVDSFGFRPDDLLGREVGAESVPVSFAEPLKRALERTFQDRRVEDIEFVYSAPSGDRRFEMRLMPEITDGEVQAVLGITREVVPHETAVPEPRPAAASISALIGAALAETASLSDFLDRCATALAEFSGAPLVRIWLWNADKGELNLAAGAGTEIAHVAVDVSTARIAIPAAVTPELLAQRASEMDAQEAEAHSLPAHDALPLETNGLALGVVVLRYRELPAHETREEIRQAMHLMAAAMRRTQDAESSTAQAAGLARELQETRRARQDEADRLASLAHELRTPLNSLIGVIELLMGSPLAPAQRELGQMARSSAEALQRLVNETFEDVKAEPGTAAPEAGPFDLRDLVEDVGVMLAARAQAKGIDLIVRCAPNMPERFIGDAGHIRQILTNLVDNAIKFTREGFVLLDAASEAPVDGHAAVRIEVEDTGAGIAPELQAAVFERYMQAAPEVGREENGMGLGLAISRELAEKMGGTLDLRSQPEAGSVFRLTLRLPVDVEAQQDSDSEILEGMRVLVVDGPQLQQFAAREQMAAWKVRVELCATVGAMLDAVQTALEERDPYAAVLLDERVAGRETTGVISAALATRAFEHVRLVLLTAASRSQDVERIVSETRAATLARPIRRRLLLETLVRIAREQPARVGPASLSGALEAAANAERPARQDEDETAAYAERLDRQEDAEEARDRTYALVVEDDIVNQRVAKMMLEKMGCVVDVASNGDEAIALFETRVYDLVLVDCRLSGMDGYETTAALRRMEAGERHTPIVAVTADTSPGVRERCLAAGMDAYIAKPVHAEDLQYEIEKLLNSALPARVAPPQAPIDDIVDRRALMARVANNTDVLRSLANLCEAECGRLMAEIREAVNAGDRSEFLRATHKLRGNIMSMEARAAVETVKELERTASEGRPADAERLLDPLEKELALLVTAMNAILDEADEAAENR